MGSGISTCFALVSYCNGGEWGLLRSGIDDLCQGQCNVQDLEAELLADKCSLSLAANMEILRLSQHTRCACTHTHTHQT
eukprot:1615994-Amphidinium_carterae.1